MIVKLKKGDKVWVQKYSETWKLYESYYLIKKLAKGWT